MTQPYQYNDMGEYVYILPRPKTGPAAERIRYALSRYPMGALEAQVYVPFGKYPQKGEDGYSSPEVSVATRLDPSQPELKSWLGLPVFDRLKLTNPADGSSVEIDAVLFEVTGTRNIVKTEVEGLPYTVKELISNSDYEITIRGIITSESQDFPYDRMSSFVAMTEAEAALDCDSDFLSLFGIFHLVIEKTRFFQKAGAQNYQTFELNCSSDMPVELKIDKEG